MSNFLVSARKYRPVNFDTVVGQPAISNTLKSAIRSAQVAHAYLFCGPRGVGKTTCARIFAKTLNCFNLSENIEACEQCESCKSFNESRSYNIHELDAASNNSVDDIRSLIEKVRILPQVGKYSIYIIDEVHMLSQAAFNAFLKTLEEPPAHAIFILATTEKHKIIPTILSRCQIFDFNRIRVEDIVGYLSHVARLEEISYEEEALNVIALKADGAMRDALSIFDQVASFSQKNITYAEVLENLNVLDYEYYFKVTDAFLNQDAAGALVIFDEILQKGFDGQNFIGGLSSHLRDLLVCRDASTVQLLEVSDSLKGRYRQQAMVCEPDFLFQALVICDQCELTYKPSKNQRLHVEIALIRLSNLQAQKKNLKSEQPALSIPEIITSASSPAGITQRPSIPSQAQGTTPIPATSPIPTTSPTLSTSPSSVQTQAPSHTPGQTEIPESTPAQAQTPAPALSTSQASVSSPATAPAQASPRPPSPEPEVSATTASSHQGARPQSDPKEKPALSTEPDQLYQAPPRISIKEALQAGKKAEIPVSQPEDPAGIVADATIIKQTPVTQELLIESWNNFAIQIREEKPRMAVTLKSVQPEFSGSAVISIKLNNRDQLEDFNSTTKSELEKYLRRELQNDLISIDAELLEPTGPAQVRLYTSEEKFKYLSRKNPVLSKFRQNLNLELE
jgi:DNA polymerase III subunit gamma/tau